MDQDEASPPRPRAERKVTPPGNPGDDAFDVWLQRSLHQLYDSVTSEPIPAELLKLIEDDKERRGP